MPVRLDTADSDFDARFQDLLDSKRESSQDVSDTVSRIIADVRARGDAAVLELTNKFDRTNFAAADLRISPEEIEQASAQVSEEVRTALQTAHDRIRAHHEKQKPEDHVYQDALGVTLGTRWTPVDAVGIYVPGGLATYPSTVIMGAVPAKLAGVERIALAVPTPGGQISASILLAAQIAGVTEIYRIGGAQAIAALAYGTETVGRVDKIVGPGNAYVAAAKRQVFGQVGIDSIAGPSEVLIIADGSANPAWIAADLIAQAEHGGGAQSILVTTEKGLADSVAAEVDRQLSLLPKQQIAREGWEEFGAIITVASLEEAASLANRIASEHVELALDDPQSILPAIRHAGAIFLGHHTPEAIGDYVGGSNHVLPTARSARFASGLGVLDFMKRTSILGCDPTSLSALAEAAVAIAEVEALDGHGRSISIRLNR
ncbi:histidinol dehydrogenase [Devosia albogilva]|uniref:Histidinol dehydrogenase n=1 Tax=Devosia albogilva TaxID=429726 RepID=A0ABW5QMD1_9HYPH